MKSIQAPHSSQPSSPAGSNVLRRLWNWWSVVTGPRKDAFKADIFAQERLRRARLVSALLILIGMVVLLLIPSTYPSSPSIWVPIFILSAGAVIIALFNRAGYTTLSSIFYVLLVDIALTGFFYFKPTPALNSTNMTALDLFVLAVLVGGVILPRALILLTGILQILLICMIFFLRPHDASLVALIEFAGNVYVALAPTIVLQVVGTGLAWLHAWSVERALIRASQAEELAEARAQLNQQALLTEQQKQRLEEGIKAILEIHRQVAVGNLAARVPVHEDQELWQVGHALNLLLMRIQQQTQSYRFLQTTNQEIERLVHVLDATPPGVQPALPIFRTPLVQHLLNVLRR